MINIVLLSKKEKKRNKGNFHVGYFHEVDGNDAKAAELYALLNELCEQLPYKFDLRRHGHRIQISAEGRGIERLENLKQFGAIFSEADEAPSTAEARMAPAPKVANTR